MELPKYRVLRDTFIAPHVLREGSVIRTPDMPGDHLEPLNPEAVARMEEWYEIEIDELDPKTYQKTGAKLRPNAGKRPVAYEAAPRPTVELISFPPKEEKLIGLAEAMAQRAEPDLMPTGEKNLMAQGSPLVPIGETAGNAVVEGAVLASDSRRKAG